MLTGLESQRNDEAQEVSFSSWALLQSPGSVWYTSQFACLLLRAKLFFSPAKKSSICNEFNLKISLPVIYCDNQGALALAKNDGVSQRTKHIEIRDLFAKEAVKTGLVDVKYLKTEDMPADIFTKPLAKVKFLHLRPLLGLKYSEAQ